MGNDNSGQYNRNESIQKLENKSHELEKDIDKMWQDPIFSVEECVNAQKVQGNIDTKVKSLKAMNEYEKKFSQINLDEYRNKNGNFNVYALQRPLNNSSSNKSGTMSSKLFHGGVAIGNGQKMIYTDYGVGEGNSAVRFWDSNENKDNFQKINKIGESTLSNHQIKNTLFGKESENWSSPNSYSLIGHNCQNYQNQIIKDLMENK